MLKFFLIVIIIVLRSPDSSIDTSIGSSGGGHQIDHEFEEMKWGLNMALIGDGHWKSFHMVEDIKNIVTRSDHNNYII